MGNLYENLPNMMFFDKKLRKRLIKFLLNMEQAIDIKNTSYFSKSFQENSSLLFAKYMTMPIR